MEKYEKIKKFSQGGMGRLYLAQEKSTGTLVAIKEVKELTNDTEARLRFEREILALKKIDHENVVPILDSGQTDNGTPYLVMPYLQGCTLREFLDTGQYETGLAVDLTFQLLSAVSAAHKNGIVHRDIKPDNIFLENTEIDIRLQVLDFGVAKLLDEEQNTLTMTGAGVGTAKYMSPEQALNAKCADERTDVYALGLILYELFTKRNPLENCDDYCAAIPLHIPKPAHINPDISPYIEKIVLKALSRVRERRYTHAFEMLLEFSEVAFSI